MYEVVQFVTTLQYKKIKQMKFAGQILQEFQMLVFDISGQWLLICCSCLDFSVYIRCSCPAHFAASTWPETWWRYILTYCVSACIWMFHLHTRRRSRAFSTQRPSGSRKYRRSCSLAIRTSMTWEAGTQHRRALVAAIQPILMAVVAAHSLYLAVLQHPGEFHLLLTSQIVCTISCLIFPCKICDQ